MFKKFKELFSSENLLDESFETTVTMLEDCHEMYRASCRALRETDSAELPFDIKAKDVQINRYQREVRANVLTHLSVVGSPSVVASLVMVSIVIDVERIGDYTKNIYDLARVHPQKLTCGPHEKDVVAMEEEVRVMFPKVIQSLREQDIEAARDVMRHEDPLGKQADAVMYAIVANEVGGLSAGDATATALYARYLKRINAHLSNIASALVNPFPRLGYREKVKKEK